MQCIMENIKTCELCLEQIIKTEHPENLNCDEKQDLRILKNLEITVSRDAKICSNCISVSNLTYNFKTSCLTNNDHLKTLIHPGINDKLILEEVIVKKTKSEFKNEEKICRFCLNFSEVNSLVEVNLEQDVVLKDMLERCLPEIETNIVQNPLICYICSKLLEKSFTFLSQCEDTEVLRNLDTKTDVLVKQNTSTVTVTNNDDNTDVNFVKEENCGGIKDPELQIKSEDFDIDEDIKDSINDSNCLLKEGEIRAKPSSFPLDLTHQQTHWKTIKSTTCKLYKCTDCTYQSEYQSNLIRHKKNSEKVSKCNMCSFTASNKCEIEKHKKEVHLAVPGLYKCHKCPYVSKWKRGLASHNLRWHEDSSKVPKYKCDECPYETLWIRGLVGHKIKHRDSSEVKMYKCMECSYETKRKGSLKIHKKRHSRNRQDSVKVEQSLSNPVEEKDLKPKPRGTIPENVCDICLLQTSTKYTLKKHYLVHKESSEVNVFKCDYCPFATKYKDSLAVHTIRHKNPSELPIFKCSDCPYETNNKRNLISHLLVHRNPSQVNMYKCKVCPYQTKYKSCIRVHKKKHQVKIYTCDECDYKTKLEKSFLVHLQYHEGSKQPAKSSQNLEKVSECTYKCNECSYVGTRKSNLIQHQKLHKDPSKRETYTCIECSFQAVSKITLKRHYSKNHSDLEIPFGELKTFQHNECDYETTHNECISKHLQAHEQEEMTSSIKEELQEEDNVQDKEGTYSIGF